MPQAPVHGRPTPIATQRLPSSIELHLKQQNLDLCVGKYLHTPSLILPRNFIPNITLDKQEVTNGTSKVEVASPLLDSTKTDIMSFHPGTGFYIKQSSFNDLPK